MNAHGIVHKYGDHVDTDVIIPARYLNTQSHKELASHCMEDIDKDFIHRVKDGNIIVAGVNFGCGSSTRPSPSKRAASPASSRRISPASSTATPSTSASPFWSAPPRARTLKMVTR